MAAGLLQQELLIEVIGVCRTQEETGMLGAWVMSLWLRWDSRVDKNSFPWFLRWTCLDASAYGATLPHTAVKVREGQGTPQS